MNIFACLIMQKQKNTKSPPTPTKTALEDSCLPIQATPFARLKVSESTSPNAHLMPHPSTFIHWKSHRRSLMGEIAGIPTNRWVWTILETCFRASAGPSGYLKDTPTSVKKHCSSNAFRGRAGEQADHVCHRAQVWNKPEKLLGTFRYRKKEMELDPLRKQKYKRKSSQG